MKHAPEHLDLTNPLDREAALRRRMEDAVTILAEQLSEGHTAEFLSLLRFYSRFWTYSVRNCLLIKLQCPGATRCAGRSLWNRMGYHIRKGERAIWIWAPVLKKDTDPDTGEILTLVAGFRPAPVFDFGQLAECEERPLPALVPHLPDDIEAEYQRCLRKVTATGITVMHQPLSGTTLGLSRPGQIAIATGLDSRNRLFVLLHELTHALWHQTEDGPDPERSRQQAEFEAEAVAYVAAAVMGLEHPGARDYLLNWRATPELLHRSLVFIQAMVRRVLVVLEIPFDVPHTPEALIA